MLPVDEPVWLATFLPRSCSTLVMPRSLRAITRAVLPTYSIMAMATRPPLSLPMAKRGPGIGAHVDLARHHLLHGEVARRHGEFLELDAVLLELAGAQQVIGRHAPHVGLVALPHGLQRRAGAAHAQSGRQHAGAGRHQRMAARDAFVQNVMLILPYGFYLSVGRRFLRVSFSLASWPRWRSNSFWHSRNSTLSGSRGRGSGILISAFTVPGCGVITTTRSAR